MPFQQYRISIPDSNAGACHGQTYVLQTSLLFLPLRLSMASRPRAGKQGNTRSMALLPSCPFLACVLDGLGVGWSVCRVAATWLLASCSWNRKKICTLPASRPKWRNAGCRLGLGCLREPRLAPPPPLPLSRDCLPHPPPRPHPGAEADGPAAAPAPPAEGPKYTPDGPLGGRLYAGAALRLAAPRRTARAALRPGVAGVGGRGPAEGGDYTGMCTSIVACRPCAPGFGLRTSILDDTR